jgi:hypothetical protein
MVETERERIPVFLDADLKAAIKIRHAASKGFSFQSVAESLMVQWAEAGMPYPVPEGIIEPKEQTAEQRIEQNLIDWLRTCHKNPADYLAAELACRRALGIKADDWVEFQKGLRK